MIDICDSVKEQLQQLRHEAIRFGKPRSGEFVLTDKGRIYRFLSDSNFIRLIVRPIPPRMVPLGPEDVEANRTIIQSKYGQSVVLTVCSDGVTYAPPFVDPESRDTALPSIANAGVMNDGNTRDGFRVRLMEGAAKSWPLQQRRTRRAGQARVHQS